MDRYELEEDDTLVNNILPLHIACEEMNFFWSEAEVIQFKKLWDAGENILYIAEQFNRDPDEVGLLIIDQARVGNIASRHTAKFKQKIPQVIAKVEKVKKDTPTVLTVHGQRYVLEHPDQWRGKKK